MGNRNKKYTAWSEERVQAMTDWQRENGASYAQTAHHFKVSENVYSWARRKYGFSKKRKKKEPTKMLEMVIPDAIPGQSKAALIIVNQSDVASIVRSLWQ